MTKRLNQPQSRFIPAAELKSTYDVFGHFYSVQISRNHSVDCRSVLEIVAQGVIGSGKVQTISQRKPDAVFIMMNPGSSRPLVEVNNRIAAEQLHEMPISLVPTKPDTTQYQVMRVMHHCQWQHVRVLNLSDLRCAQSPAFIKQFKSLEADAAFDAHSIFSDRRTGELSAKLTTDRKVTVVCAWGVSPHLEPLIERCTSRINRHKLIRGLLKPDTTNKYLHPLPTLQSQKLVWVQRMVEQCRDFQPKR